MGDGNITWKATDQGKAEADGDDTKLPSLPLSVEVKENTCKDNTSNVNEATPRSTTDDTTTKTTDDTPKTPTALELEELHRNTNNSVNTPELSSASIDSPAGNKPAMPTTPRRRNLNRNGQPQASSNEYGLPLGPAAGLGPQEAAPDANHEIFSVRGTRSFKIPRYRDSVTVFPSGCMGINDMDPSKASSTQYGRPNSALRNPLTGQGYDEADKKQNLSKKRADGNPVLGQGYEDAKNVRAGKVPPGGYSKGLW